MENKNGYSILKIGIPENKLENEALQEEIKNSVDLVLASMGVEDNSEENFIKNDNSRLIYIFKTKQRKRKGQLVKFCDRYLPKEIEYETEGVQKIYATEQLIRLRKHEKFRTLENIKERRYEGDDIKVLDNRKNWKQWQIDIFQTFFKEDFTFQPSVARRIISLVDYKGGSGKSLFFKWLLVKLREKEISRISFGTSTQLRSSVIAARGKKMYILDLTRTKGKGDREHDLLSVLESIVDGMIYSPRYGKYETLLMEPPHVLITSNYALDYTLLSLDRWKVYEIKENGTLGKENEILQKILEEKKEKDNYKQKKIKEKL
jgi:hypothetical protein